MRLTSDAAGVLLCLAVLSKSVESSSFVPPPSSSGVSSPNSCTRILLSNSCTHLSTPYQYKGPSHLPLHLSMEEEEEIIDAIIVDEIRSSAAGSIEDQSLSFLDPTTAEGQLRKRDVAARVLGRLADLSLQDYEWRSAVFKENEADRAVEESLARMMGEDPSYVRPMDASEDKMGPLGWAEKRWVEWLSSVIEEEGKRAKKISSSDGKLFRPIDLDASEGGPLSRLERRVVNFLNSIRDSETERVNTKTLRPKDLDETKRGPLGDAEARAMSTLEEIANAERLRLEQSRLRGGEVVRPIDVPGPLGEIELKVMDAMEAERQRSKEKEERGGVRVRPMDASVPGPFGEAERNAMEGLDKLKAEETERFKNLRRFIRERRPMESYRESPLGLTEAFTVGLLNAPRLLQKVSKRVMELMNSEGLDEKDVDILKIEPAGKTAKNGTRISDGEEERA